MAFPRKFLVLTLFLLAMAAGARAATEGRTLLPESIKALDPVRVRSVQALRKEHLGKEIDFQIALKMRDYPKLLARLATGARVPHDEMEARYLPLPADYQAVIDWAKSQALTVTQTDPYRLAVFVKGTVAQIQTATRSQFAEVTVADGTYTSAVTAPSIPTALAGPVLGLNGLQPHIHPRHAQTIRPLIDNSPPYLINEIKGAYGASGLAYTGSGETIAILIDTFPESSDLTKFWSYNGIPQSLSNITEIQAVAGTLDPVSGEETLDTEWTSGIASQAQIRIYATTDLSFTDLDRGLQRILSDLPGQPSLHELSISLGLGEDEVSASQKLTDSQYFANITDFGVSIFVASGDDGAFLDDALQPSYYASDPNVTGVGGTTLDLYPSGSVEAETGWNGSGGGISSFFARPSWQVGNGVPSGSYRLVPDVACAADPNTGAYVYLQGHAQQIGGTSWATPTWAGFCALINQARTANGLAPLGLLNPRIYPLIGAGAFRDITSGNNGSGNFGGYSAGVGYDLVTGIGTPMMNALLPDLSVGVSNTPVVTSFSPVVGPVGATVAVTGVDFEAVTGLEFNGAAAQFTINSENSITTTVPAGATTGPITLLSATGSTTSSIDYTVVALPTNDAFANAITISGTEGQVNGSNIGATRESGEPDIAGNPGGASVWWVWQSPDNGTYTFSTAGSSFDTLLGVFTGTAVDALTTIAADDDYGTAITSSVTFTATAGATYDIAVDGYNSNSTNPADAATGAIVLSWEENAAVPVISSFSPQTGLPGTVVTVMGANFLGTTAATIGGTNAAFNVENDTEMTVTVPANAPTGPIGITGALGTTYSSANFVVISPVPNDNFAAATQILGAVGGITGNNSGATREPGEPEIAGNPGGASIWYEWTPNSNGPETFTTFGSTFPTLLGVFTGYNVASLTPVAEDAAYGNTVTSSVTFLAQAGTVYHIAVDGYNGATGNVALNWAKDDSLPVITGFSPTSGPVDTTVVISGSGFTGATDVSLGGTSLAFTVLSDSEITALVPPGASSGLISVGNLLGAVDSSNPFTITAGPTNDDFADAIPLSGADVHVTGANVGATREPGEPEIEGNPGGASVWWSWTAPNTGVFAVSTQGSNFATLLGVFTGDAVDALTLVAQNANDPSGGETSYVTFTATAGTVYRIAVDGLNGSAGSIGLSIFPAQLSTGLYSTAFETADGFTAGDPLEGQDGWQTIGTGGNGIVTGYDGMTGQQAYIGNTPPTAPGTLGVDAYRPIDYSPVGTAEPVVTFSVSMAINDSKNGNYDHFQWHAYNSKRQSLFALDFSNADLRIRYQLGSGPLNLTGLQFINNTPLKLVVVMNYADNLWSATLDGTPLVTNKAIRTGSDLLDFGSMDAVWQISEALDPGDNYLLFDNYSLIAGQDPTPSITFQPQSQTVTVGNSATLGVVAAGATPLYYQWFQNKKMVPGAQAASLTISDAQPADAGSYTVEVSNAIKMVTSAPAKLTVAPQPSAPTITTEPASITVAAGSTAVFTAAASGDPAPGYQWRYNGSPIGGATQPTYKVRGAQASNQGSYTVVASNTLGSGTSAAAVLTVGNSFASEKGNFNAMVFDGPDDVTGSGLLKVTMGAGGSFTGSVSLAGTTYRMAGAFNPEGFWQGTVGHGSGGLPVVVTLQLSLSGVDEITGSITAGDVTETATAPRDNYSKSGPVAPEEPAYTMTLTGTSTGLPGGVGYAAITVDGAGNIRAAGRLGDDTMYSFSSVVSGSGTWPFYASLYKSMGYIGGTLTFEQNGQTDLDGTLYWMRPATEGFGGYASGFAGAVAAAGYVYTPPAKDAPAIPLDGQHLGLITFSGGVLGPPIDAQVSLGPTNGLVVSGTSGVKFTLTPSTGVFTGTLNAGLAKPLPFYGVLLQSLDGGEGLFQSPTISGPVQITSP